MPNPTPDSRDKEAARRIKYKINCKLVNHPVIDEAEQDFITALSSARREGEAAAAALREVLQILADPKRGCVPGSVINQVLSSATAGANYLKRLEDAERKAWAFDWLANPQFRTDIQNPSRGFLTSTDKESLLEAIEAAAKEPK